MSTLELVGLGFLVTLVVFVLYLLIMVFVINLMQGKFPWE